MGYQVRPGGWGLGVLTHSAHWAVLTTHLPWEGQPQKRQAGDDRGC